MNERTLFPDVEAAELVPAENVTVASPSTGEALPGPSCENCGQSFTPCNGTGGRPQRFCSAECRRTNNAKDGPKVPTLAPTSLMLGDVIAPGVRVGVVVERSADDERECFGWMDQDNPDLFCHDQPATAIYINPYGQVVIRQESTWGNDDDDPFVRFSPEHLPALIRRLQACLREIQEGTALAR